MNGSLVIFKASHALTDGLGMQIMLSELCDEGTGLPVPLPYISKLSIFLEYLLFPLNWFRLAHLVLF